MSEYKRYEFIAEFDDNISIFRRILQRRALKWKQEAKHINARVQGSELGRMRKDAGFTQEQLAQAMGVMISHIIAIENGSLEALTFTTVCAYSNALGGKIHLASNVGALKGALHLAVETDTSTDSEE